MAHGNVANVSAGKPAIGGAVFWAPLGTTLPTDAVSQLDAAFKSLGYCSEDGATNSNAPSTSDIKAWGGDPVLTTQDEKPDRWQVKLIEALNENVLKVVYGSDHVTGTLAAGLTVEVDSSEAEEGVWVIDMILRGDVAHRIVIPRGKITDLEDINYVDNDVIGYGITIAAFPDSAGKTHRKYYKSA